MLVVLEGIDGGGKTRLAAELWGQVEPTGKAVITHHGPPKPYDRCAFKEYISPLDQDPLVLSTRDLVITDRLHVGDTIYRPYRPDKKPRLTPAGVLHCELALSSMGAVKVICSPPLEVVQKRVADRGDDYISHDDLPRIHAEYLAHAQAYRYMVPGWQQSPMATAKSLILTARGVTPRAQLFHTASAGTYTGSLWPEVIFAGDEPGALGAEYPRPFTPADGPGGCSEWLLSAFMVAGIIGNIGLVNVNHPAVSVDFIARLAPDARWVALGNRASATLKKHYISHAIAHHPQYARRFRHSDHAGYTAELRTAAGLTAERELSGDHR